MGSNGEQWEAMGKDQQEQQSSYSIADTLPFKQSNFRWHSRSRQSMMGQQQRCLSLAKNRWNMIFLSQPYSLKSSHDRLFLKHRVSWRNSVCKLRKLQKLVGSLPLFFAASLRRTPGGRRPLLLGRCWLRGRYRGGRGILSKQWFLQRKSWTNQIKTGLKNVKEIEMALSERSSILHFNAKPLLPAGWVTADVWHSSRALFYSACTQAKLYCASVAAAGLSLPTFWHLCGWRKVMHMRKPML